MSRYTFKATESRMTERMARGHIERKGHVLKGRVGVQRPRIPIASAHLLQVMFAPKARAVLTGSTPRKVTVLHRIDCGDGSQGEADKVTGVDAYHVRTTTGARLTVPGSQLLPRNSETGLAQARSER